MEKGRRGFVVAVDGYSSTGKSTVSKLLAAQLGFTYIDTGAMYRVVTLKALREDLIHEGVVDEDRLKLLLPDLKIDFRYNEGKNRYESYLDGELVEDVIRGMDVSDKVSLVAALPCVREILVEKQREMARDRAVIMDGRDIGSVVFPKADVKFFLTASAAVRAERRYKELRAKGEAVTFEEVKANVEKRDYIDEHRAVGPLKQVPDALVIDNGCMTIDEEVREMAAIIVRKYESRD